MQLKQSKLAGWTARDYLLIFFEPDRGGIGIDTARKRKLAEEEQEELERQKKLDMDPVLYREHMAEKAKEGKRSRQIVAAARLCETKDLEKVHDECTRN